MGPTFLPKHTCYTSVLIIFVGLDVAGAPDTTQAMAPTTMQAPTPAAPSTGGIICPGESLPSVAWWGDSLTAAGVVTSPLADLPGRPVSNGGVGGESSTSIAARQGGIAWPLTRVNIASMIAVHEV